MTVNFLGAEEPHRNAHIEMSRPGRTQHTVQRTVSPLWEGDASFPLSFTNPVNSCEHNHRLSAGNPGRVGIPKATWFHCDRQDVSVHYRPNHFYNIQASEKQDQYPLHIKLSDTATTSVSVNIFCVIFTGIFLVLVSQSENIFTGKQVGLISKNEKRKRDRKCCAWQTILLPYKEGSGDLHDIDWLCAYEGVCLVKPNMMGVSWQLKSVHLSVPAARGTLAGLVCCGWSRLLS